jgi:chromosome partitioning protein
MKIWSVANQKGGVGKTTTAVTLAGLCAARGGNTLIVDLDPHGSLTSYFGYDPESIESSSYNLFQSENMGKAEVLSLLRKTPVDNLQVLPASTALATLDRQLGAKGGMGLAVAKALKQLEDRYEYVLIDCPPMLGVLMVNALAACSHLVIPVQTEFLAMKGLERMQHTLDMIAKAKGFHIPYTIVPTMFDQRTRASQDSLEYLKENFSDHLWHSVIPIDTRFREASRSGKPISHFMPACRGARAYWELLDYLLDEKNLDSRAVAL